MRLTIPFPTIVFSGARAFELLSPEEQEFALNTTVTYAPQAYEYIRHCKSSEDGLTIPNHGREVSIDKLSDWQWDQVAEHPVSLLAHLDLIVYLASPSIIKSIADILTHRWLGVIL